MIRTVMQISFMRLWHNKPELVLTFVVPVIFFSIFAWIFGGHGKADSKPTRVVLCDEVQNDESRRIIDALVESESFIIQRFKSQRSEASNTVIEHRQVAERLIKNASVTAAIVVSKDDEGDCRVEVLTDSFDQVASKVVAPAVQKALMANYAKEAKSVATATATTLPRPVSTHSDVALALGMDAPGDRSSYVTTAFAEEPIATTTAASLSVPSVSVRDVLGEGKTNPIVAMYAAGIAVMFLLFSATTASGSMLEERENSTLDRLLSSRMTMDHLLLGKWTYLTLIGCLQTTVMFVSGAVFFGLELSRHWDGFVVMTLVTASAASSFALMLATMCKSRNQLGWVSTVLILSMSALGGSMVPRYLMSDEIKRVGQLTFNAWALDGYNKIFWRELTVSHIWLEVTVLGSCAALFLVVARVAAMKWERV